MEILAKGETFPLCATDRKKDYGVHLKGEEKKELRVDVRKQGEIGSMRKDWACGRIPPLKKTVRIELGKGRGGS